MSIPNVKEVVRAKYGQAALRVTSGAGNLCCRDDPSPLEKSCDPITSNLYDAAQEGEVPDTAIKASLGCGNPTALAELKPGEIVLDRVHARLQHRRREGPFFLRQSLAFSHPAARESC